MKNKTLYLIDGYNLAFRAYYAYSHINNNYQQNINCIYGFCQMINNIIKYHKPNNFIVIFDSGSKKRKEIFPDYKKNRPALPIELTSQLSCLRKVCNEFKINNYEKNGYEADDIIATLSKKYENIYQKIKIISVDKDLYQLINKNITVFHPIKKKYINIDSVIKQFGVKPEQIHELQSIIGDAVDNIPGIKGIGIKTAFPIVSKYKTLENIYKNIDNLNLSKRYLTLLKQGKNSAFLSRKLTLLNSNIKNLEENIDNQFNYNYFYSEYKNFIMKIYL